MITLIHDPKEETEEAFEARKAGAVALAEAIADDLIVIEIVDPIN
jgi:hypothetical protein